VLEKGGLGASEDRRQPIWFDDCGQEPRVRKRSEYFLDDSLGPGVADHPIVCDCDPHRHTG
jgi:hypothetical protein